MNIDIDPILLVSLSAFVGVVSLFIGVWFLMRQDGDKSVESRLEAIAGMKGGGPNGEADASRGLMKEEVLNLGTGMLASLATRFRERLAGLSMFFQQADSPIKFDVFILISLGCMIVGCGAAFVANAPTPLIPVAGICLSVVPLLWLWWRRKKRFAKFAKQLPDALELIGRALRSGHSLNSGLHLVVEEMPAPISTEFCIAYEEQNLGVPIEAALKNMVHRMPNLDLKFFVTAVAIQRQTGGDLAEILDKIGYVIRERFKILGTVQALTGEGRLSGAVLMGMPIVIFFAVYYLNPDYVMLLFTTELGKKMIAVGIVMQILGAVAIKKIIDIKV
jgi:tight adherence protein B